MYANNSLTAEIKRRRCFSRNKSLSESDLTVINASDSEHKSGDGSSDSTSPPISASDLKKKIYRKMSHGLSFLQSHDKPTSPNWLSPNVPRKVSSDSNISTVRRSEYDFNHWKLPLSKKLSSPHKLSPKHTPRKASTELNRTDSNHLELPTFTKYPNKLSPNITRKKSSESNRLEQSRIKMTKMDEVDYNDEHDPALTEHALKNINYIYSVSYNANRVNVAKSYCNAVSLDSKYHKECLNELEHYIYELKDSDVSAGHTTSDLEELRRRIETLKEELNQLKKIKERNEIQYKKCSFDLTDNASTVKKLELKNENVNRNIVFLEEKLNKYQSQYNEIYEVNRRGSNRNIMKAMHDSVKSTVRHRASSFSGVISRPLESISSFIKKERTCYDENDNHTFSFREEYENGLYEQINGSIPPRPVSPLFDATDHIPLIYHEDVSETNNLKTKLLDLEKESKELKEGIFKMKDMLVEMTKTLEEEKHRKAKLQTHLNDVFLHMNTLSEEHEKDATKMKETVIFTMERIEHMEMNFMERTAELEDSVESCCTKIAEIDTDNFYIKDGQTTRQKYVMSKILSLLFNVIFLVTFTFYSMIKRMLSFLPDLTSRLVVFGVTSFVIYYFVCSVGPEKNSKEL